MNFWSLCPFSDFYLIFIWYWLSTLFIKITKKGISYLQVMTWRAGPVDELTWRAGPQRGCNVALRPRGRATGGPPEAQVAHRARTRGRMPRVSMRVHADACEGATWRERLAREASEWRAHGLVGSSESIGAVTQMRYRDPQFNNVLFFFFLRVGLKSRGV